MPTCLHQSHITFKHSKAIFRATQHNKCQEAIFFTHNTNVGSRCVSHGIRKTGQILKKTRQKKTTKLEFPGNRKRVRVFFPRRVKNGRMLGVIERGG